MAKNNIFENENILIKTDQNNLIYIDPNSVVDSDGNVSPRGVKQENLAIYVNLEADIVPRSILYSENDKDTLISVARGTLNFLSNQDGTDFDTTWTDAFLEKTPKKPPVNLNVFGTNVKIPTTDEYYSSDKTGQSFGIDSISITTKGANAIPTVTINFIDVRGKTLFESAANSPYTAFFHIPWPIFYLTLKGFYGKAIRYRLHLTKFSTRYNDTYGNFEVSTTFVGSTFAYLSDIPLKAMLNCPYMYESDIETETFANEKNNDKVKKMAKTSKGYAILKSVYDEYKRKNLIDKDFPVKTLREVVNIARTLDVILEKTILDEVVDKNLFVGLKDFEEKINLFETQVLAWGSQNLTGLSVPDPSVPTDYDDEFNKVISKCYEIKDFKYRTDATIITGTTEGIQNGPSPLGFLIKRNSEALKQSSLFNEEIKKAAQNKKTGGADFSDITILSKSILSIDHYYYNPTKNDNQYRVKIDKLLNHIREIKKTFEKQKNKLQDEVEQKMNEILKKPTVYENGKYQSGGIGFEPTIKNIFAIILANAEVYIRLLKDVHYKATDPETVKERSKNLKSLSDETKGGPPIYPWPEIKKKGEGQKSQVLAYPADPDLLSKLRSDDYKLWPEVEFVENYIEVSTNKSDPNSSLLSNNPYSYSEDISEKLISSLSLITNAPAYLDKSPSSFLYEIYERALNFTLLDSFRDETLKELAKIEFENIQNNTFYDEDIIKILLNIKNENDLINLMKKFSPFTRNAYLNDQIPSTQYLKDFYDYPFSITSNKISAKSYTPNVYPNVIDNLKYYKKESYRKSIYPFNSDLYKSYINVSKDIITNEDFYNTLSVENSLYFITSPINPKAWIDRTYQNNLFRKKLLIDDNYISMLNAPYFHQQLYYDFQKTALYGKYSGSAYLLLNSLPFYDLQEKIYFNDKDKYASYVRMSDLFREVGATHYIPYHLILKWGSIYHRYKTYLQYNKDILDGFINTQNVTQEIDKELFFDNKTNDTFTIGGELVNVSIKRDIGIHPYYDAIFSQVINGYTHYNVTGGSASYNQNVISKAIIEIPQLTSNLLKYWFGLVDNTKFDSKDLRYTILPSQGYNKQLNIDSLDNSFSKDYDSNFRIIIDDETIPEAFTGKTFPAYNQYHKSFVTGNRKDKYDNKYSIDNDYRKILDLIGTFDYRLLEEFEDLFLKFASEKMEGETSIQFDGVKYNKFQDLLKEIASVNKTNNDDNLNPDILKEEIKYRQLINLENVTKNILSETNLLKITIANPKDINPHVFHGFAEVTTGNTFSYNDYYPQQLNNNTINLIELYIGEDIDNHYKNFFIVNDIELNEDNIKQFRQLAMIYAGYVTDGNLPDSDKFKEYIKNNVFLKNKSNGEPSGSITRLSSFLTFLTQNFANLKTRSGVFNKKIVTGYNNNDLKLEIYNNFKSFNDKWIGGNSIGQRLLLEEFLFLDKANKDIGDKFFLNLTKLLDLESPNNDKINLYDVIGILIRDTGLDMKPLPSYINFYGAKNPNTGKIMPSKKIADTLFGTFLEVDYLDSTPKIILQLVGQTSKRPDVPSPDYKYNDDSFDLSSVNNNPLIITIPDVFNRENLIKSNRVVAFEVSFGDSNQSIFKGVQLDQASLKASSESYVVLENLARSESGAGAYNVDIGLYDYYRQASYTCEVTCMGNAIIQPTMYFYLKNIPMFKGAYLITEVSHSIKSNTFNTVFKGYRIPKSSLPDPKDSFVSSYRTLFDKLKTSVLAKIKSEQTANTLVSVKTIDNKSVQTDLIKIGTNEDLPAQLLSESSINKFGLPYNGYGANDDGKYTQYINFLNDKYYRGIVVEIGKGYNIDGNTVMTILSEDYKKVTWSEISGATESEYFFMLRLQYPNAQYNRKIAKTAKVDFYNPAKAIGTTSSISTSVSEVNGKILPVGLISEGPNLEKYSVAMSRVLMRTLSLYDGDPVYFKMI